MGATSELGDWTDEIERECAREREWDTQNEAQLAACPRHDFVKSVTDDAWSKLFLAALASIGNGRGLPSDERRAQERDADRQLERAEKAAWTCRRCGGAVPHLAATWYMKGLAASRTTDGAVAATDEPAKATEACDCCGRPVMTPGGTYCDTCLLEHETPFERRNAEFRWSDT